MPPYLLHMLSPLLHTCPSAAQAAACSSRFPSARLSSSIRPTGCALPPCISQDRCPASATPRATRAADSLAVSRTELSGSWGVFRAKQQLNRGHAFQMETCESSGMPMIPEQHMNAHLHVPLDQGYQSVQIGLLHSSVPHGARPDRELASQPGTLLHKSGWEAAGCWVPELVSCKRSTLPKCTLYLASKHHQVWLGLAQLVDQHCERVCIHPYPVLHDAGAHADYFGFPSSQTDNCLNE